MIENDNSPHVVMVVDDDKDIREMLKVTLYAHGYTVLEAANGLEAVQLVKRACPDMILMDLEMPVLDGFAATRLIREVRETCDVPIVACSAHGTPAYRLRAFAAGCNDYLTKPIDFVQLNNLLGRILAAA